VKPIVKFNGGRGALLCNKCHVIIKEDLTEEEASGETDLLFCDECFMKNVSRKISYLLRHNPEDLKMDDKGWVSTNDLLEKLGITLQELKYIVESNDKKRFAFSGDKLRIRASQGHSEKLGLTIDFKEVQFPKNYYHGTIKVNVASILKSGLNTGTRAYVHLSKDVETAVAVGKRHGKDVVILIIDGNQMKRDGWKIFESENGVILAQTVPGKYIKVR
jgi:putative RNA 2'-phosphotransferase